MHVFVLLILSLFSAMAFTQDLRTLSERSGWTKTGRAQEVEQLCTAFAEAFPKIVRCHSYGRTPEERRLMYLTVGDLSKPRVWVQAGIHAGEIDGKDAVFALLRDTLELKRHPGLFSEVSMVFVPIVNLDGHERFGRWNRPNQVGPLEMGWRTTAQNINMNRDFLKVDAPEMKDLLTLWHKMDPVLSLDLHVTNGADFRPEVGLIIHPHTSFGTSPLHVAGAVYETSLLQKMKERGHLALPFYPTFEVEDDPSSGFARYVSTPRFAHGYWFNNNRLGMLVETHSWKDYATRVKTHYNTVLASLEIAKLHGKDWRRLGKDLDRENLRGQHLPVDYQHTPKSQLIEFPGYKFTIIDSEISGSKVIQYDPKVPEVWKVPFYEELVPSLMVKAPLRGYYVQPADAGWLLPKLKVHRIRFEKIRPKKSQEFEVFRASRTQFSPSSFEGHQNLIVEGEWKREKVALPPVLYFVPIAQAKARLILQIFEPKAKDSYLSWGFFNRAFEKKEYMEHYVAQEVATELLKDPEVKKEFDEALAKDDNLRKDPSKRFEFFHKKHPSWDERYNRYPVFKL